MRRSSGEAPLLIAPISSSRCVNYAWWSLVLLLYLLNELVIELVLVAQKASLSGMQVRGTESSFLPGADSLVLVVDVSE